MSEPLIGDKATSDSIQPVSKKSNKGKKIENPKRKRKKQRSEYKELNAIKIVTQNPVKGKCNEIIVLIKCNNIAKPCQEPSPTGRDRSPRRVSPRSERKHLYKRL